MSPVSKFSSYGKFETMAMGNIKTEAPTIGTATDVGTGRAYNNGAASVTFTAPASNGSNLPITSYTVTSSPGGFTSTGASSPLTVTGLQSSTSYTFTVIATNAAGNSPASAASNSITATTVPQAPTIGTATGGNASATVTYTANATGGKAVSAYTATSSPGSLTGTGTSPITVSGLTNGTAYTFTVTATNANGTSTASAASNSVTPASPSFTMEYLVVGQGGYSNRGGGGGGAVKSGTSTWTAGNTFTITVQPPGIVNPAQSTIYSSVTSGGGGAGSGGNSNGQNGSSGGGASTGGATLYTGGTASDGGAGGNNLTSGAVYTNDAGGGGAGGAASGLNSGNGVASSITGTSIYYAGGGAGGQYTGSGTVGLGGTARSTAAAANTGAGSGGSIGTNTAGGTGVVILAYPDSNPPLTSIGGTLTYTQPTRTGYRVYRFTGGTGTVTV